MIVEIDEKSGFCNGVVGAISQAEKALAANDEVYSLGDIMHNKMEMSRLESLGLKTIFHKDLSQYSGKTVLIRAHGEPPLTYDVAAGYSINLVDATCPVVARLQRIMVKAWDKMRPINGQVVLLGKHNHPEVVGLTGQIGDENVTVVDSIEELINGIDISRPIYFLSQTTMNVSLFKEAVNILEQMSNGGVSAGNIIINDTICRHVSNRFDHLKKFAIKFDVILFISGAESSNGKALFETCKSVNPKCYKIEDSSQIDPKWFEGASTTGICGATSTPAWLMKDVAEFVKNSF